jgi:ribonuclease HII
LDEAGRGPLAGPVVAAAVMINPKSKALNPKQFQNSKFKYSKHFGILDLFRISNFEFRILMKEIKDSKKLSPKKREEFYKIITKNPQIKWGIGIVSEKLIDKINILEATKLAMERAIKNLIKRNRIQKFSDRVKFVRGYFLILDGNFKLDLPVPQKPIVKGDEKVFSCALASILAKVTRDKIMERYAKKYPKYGFDQHKGYPTKLHLKMLKKYGPCKIHRKSFSPVKICYNNKKRSKKIIKQRAIEQRTIWRKNQFI